MKVVASWFLTCMLADDGGHGLPLLAECTNTSVRGCLVRSRLTASRSRLVPPPMLFSVLVTYLYLGHVLAGVLV